VKYGFQLGSPDFAQCVMTVDQEARNRAIQRAAAAMAAFQAISTSQPEVTAPPASGFDVMVPAGGGNHVLWHQ
jgi:hypothetical protein